MLITQAEDGRYVEVNEAFAALLGYTREEILGRTAPELGLQNEDEREMVLAVIRQTGQLADVYLRLRARDGREKPVIASVQLEEIDGTAYLVTLIQDLSQHEAAEEALRSTEARFRLFFESVPLPVFVYDLETFRFLDANSTALATYGYTREEMRALTLWDIRPPEDVPAAMATLPILQRPGPTHFGVWRHQRRDGQIVEVDVTSYAFELEGRPVRISIMRDVTQRLANQRELRASEERLRLVTSVTTDAIWDRDVSTDAVEWSPGLGRVFGYTGLRTTPRDWWVERLHPEDRARVLTSVDEVFAAGGHYWSTEYRFLRADGTYAAVLDRGYAVRNDRGEPVRFVGAMVDITEQLALAEAAARAKLEERQRLARDLHDSVTQSLYSLSLLAEATRRHVEGEGVEETGSQEAVEKHIARLGEVAQFSLRQLRLLIYELRPALVAEEGLVDALRHRLEAVEQRAGVAVRLEADQDHLPPVPVQEQLFHIAQEALNNALRHAEASEVILRLSTTPDSTVMEVCDNGRGFSLNNPPSGGYGLVGMQERVERLGGQFAVESTPERGTTIRVQLTAPYRAAVDAGMETE